ncbi:MAG TPA: UDP-N-acetylmuramate dehydrogenase [bacterium]|nr:UDP-N-acetylmuramate dehydrogenase [bacterium]
MLYQENFQIAKTTYFRVGGKVDYYAEIESKRDLPELIAKIDNWSGLAKVVVGACSNILVSDNGFRGLVIKNKILGMDMADGSWRVGAGEMIPIVAMRMAKNGWAGWERIANIPGTVGGGIRGNVEAYEQSISDCIEKVGWFDFSSQDTKYLEKEECQFEYRGSIFKNDLSGKGMIMEALFNLAKGDSTTLVKKIMDDRIRRKSVQPSGWSCGCFFKNIYLDEKNYQLLQNFLGKNHVLERKLGEYFSAGILIDKVGLKGLKMGGAVVSDQHANFILNAGEALAIDIYNLYRKVQKEVYEQTGIILENEVQLVGDF